MKPEHANLSRESAIARLEVVETDLVEAYREIERLREKLRAGAGSSASPSDRSSQPRR